MSCLGLQGSLKAFVVAATTVQTNGRHLIICPDKESAAYFYNDLENIFGERDNDFSKKQILFYPTSYKRPYEPEKPDNAYILSRTEVLQRVTTSERKTLIVSYPEALSEKVCTRKILTKNTFKLKVGDKISMEFLSDLLYDYEFVNADFVVEPGQFTVRGGLIDVFSFANDYPYRIEFDGDEVESIRSFDPISQLSVEEMKQIILIPNVQDSNIVQERETILQYLGNQTVVWVMEWNFLRERVENEFSKAVQAFDKNLDQDSPMAPAYLFAHGDEIGDQLDEFHTVEFGNSHGNRVEKVFDTASQPVFNKNFELLINDWNTYREKDYAISCFSDSSKQLERIGSILNDILKTDSKSFFEPVTYSIQAGFVDNDLKMCCYTDHQIFERYHRFRLREGYAVKQAITIKELYDLKPGDYVTHIDHGIGRFDGLEMIENKGKQQEALRLIYQNGDILYVSIHSLHRIAKYSSKDGTEPTLSKLGSNAWTHLKTKTKSKVKDIARELIKLYAQRKNSPGYKFMPDSYLQTELEASFMYEDTPDQLKATIDVKRDMESEMPMDRLVCGDVGFGKTEIAIRAAFKAASDSKQVAVLVPTTVLALQHYETFRKRLGGFPVNIDYLNRFKSASEQKKTLENLKNGRTDIIIGTHRLVGKDVEFKDLGLLIIDEEQKFGVSAKEKLKQLRANVDTLTLTATPIPRTLQFSMMGARDLSIINTPPANRYPVQTELRAFSPEVIRDAIEFEIARNGQVFFVHNRIQSIMDIYDLITKYVPGVKVAVGHGQMDGDQLEKIMMGFINSDYDVLLSTTIVESGLDIPNANTIIINDAQRFGLSDLHQLRGRVGRSNKKAFCYLLTPPITTLTDEAQRRLRALEEFSDLGSGFSIALRDLDIRGAGNLLGAEQSGFINDIGFETFHKILDEAIQELKETEFKEIFNSDEKKDFVSDCVIESDMEILLPSDYVGSSTERVALYTELDHIENEEGLLRFTDNLIDRFGAVPPQTGDLLNTVRLRWIARELGFEKIVLRNGNMVANFVANKESAYYDSKVYQKIIQYIVQHPKRTQMKENGDKLQLSIKEITTVTQALRMLREIRDYGLMDKN